MSERVIDCNGREIKVGDRIAPYFEKGAYTAAVPGGVVTKVTEADGDMDDYGRNIQIGPRVYVKYDDGIEDSYLARYHYGSEDYECDDVEVEVEVP